MQEKRAENTKPLQILEVTETSARRKTVRKTRLVDVRSRDIGLQRDNPGGRRVGA